MSVLSYILVGFLGGFVGASLGLGGGAIMVPLLVYWIGFTQHQAQGTVLALLTVPVFLLATIKYHQAGNVNLQVAGFMIVGFIVGSALGAHLVQGVPSPVLRKVFGVFLVLVGVKMAFFK